MKKSFRLQGLCCANCGAKIEHDINNLPGVDSAVVNFMTTKLTIEAADTAIDAIVEQVPAIVGKYEPDVIIKRA